MNTKTLPTFAFAFMLGTCCAAAAPALASASSAATGAHTAKVTISAAGDCTLGTDAHFGGETFPVIYNRVNDPAYFFRKVKKVFAADDLSIVNLEGTLTTRGSRANKTFAFRGRPRYTKILKKGSVEAVTFANNHDHDYGLVSYLDTIENVRGAGIKLAAYSRVSTYTVNGVKVGMLAVNSIDHSTVRCQQWVRDGLKKLKKKGCQVRIVSMHSGIERDHYPNGQQKAIARYAVRKGADLVLGAHPHVLQGVERYKGVYIVYSLGNFCFGGNSNPSDKDTMIFRKTFKVKFNAKGKGKVKHTKKAKVIPCSVSSVSWKNNYQPREYSYKSAAGKRVVRRVNTYSRGFGVKFSKKGNAK